MNLADWSEGIVPDGLESLLPAPSQMPTASMPIRDSPENARGYREVDTLYSCIPDPSYPWNPDMVKAIREFLPDVVPMWVQWVFMRPNSKEKVVFGRHALGRTIKDPGRDLMPFRCSMPTLPCGGLHFEKPNRIWFIHEGERNRDYPDIPGTYLPFDDSIVHRARESVRYMQLSDKEFRAAMEKELITDVAEARERKKALHADERAQRDHDFHMYADKLMETVSDVEIEEYRRSVGRRDRATKPMVYYGADYPR